MGVKDRECGQHEKGGKTNDIFWSDDVDGRYLVRVESVFKDEGENTSYYLLVEIDYEWR